MRLSRRTIAKVQAWVDKQKPAKLRKVLTENWIFDRDAKDIAEMPEEDLREMIMEDIKSDDDQVEVTLESLGIDVEYGDDDGGDDDDFGDDEEE